jgi:hypothetical protein
MGHELRPRSRELLTVAEVERRLRAMFACVQLTDHQVALDGGEELGRRLR